MACRELFFDLLLPVGQPVHRGVDLVGAGTGHTQVRAEGGVGPPGGVDSFEPGRTTRETISATTMSRARHAGPSSAGKPSFRAIAATAATCPCGSDRTMLNRSGRHQRLPLQRRLDRGDRLGGQRSTDWPASRA